MYNSNNYLSHHGIDGQKWGQQNGPPYPLDANDHSAAEKRAGSSGWAAEAKRKINERRDSKWAQKNDKKMQSLAKKGAEKDDLINAETKKRMYALYEAAKNDRGKYFNNKGQPNMYFVAKYNQIMADAMNKYFESLPETSGWFKANKSTITSPSGKEVRFVAKRGESGVFTALVTPGYDMSTVRNGANAKSGKVGYQNNTLRKI